MSGDTNQEAAREQPKTNKSGCLKKTLVAFGVLIATLGLIYYSYLQPRLYRALCSVPLYYGPFQVGNIFAMDEANNGIWPPLSRVPGKFFFRWDEHELWAIGTMSDCPANGTEDRYVEHPKREEDAPYWDDYDYLYLGYMIRTDSEARAFLKMYPERIESGAGFEEDIEVELDDGSRVMLYRLRTFNRAIKDGIVPEGTTLDEFDDSHTAIIERRGNHPHGLDSGISAHGNFLPRRYDGPLVQDWFWDEIEILEARYEN